MRNMSYVLVAMNFAAKSDSGVRMTTTSVMRQSKLSMNPSVPAIVSTPVKSCVKPRSNPSANCSVSEIIRLTISPDGCASR